VNSKVTL
jgi:hypothetical protein